MKCIIDIILHCNVNVMSICEGLHSHRPVQHVLQDVDGHDDARLPAAVQGEDGEIGREHVGGLLSVCSRSCTTAAGGEQGGREMRSDRKKKPNESSLRSFIVSNHQQHLVPLPRNTNQSNCV